MPGSIRVAELFAGVGGFRLGLEGYDDEGHPGLAMPAAGPYETVWANQWEPPGTEARQFAWRCYEERFGAGSCVNEDVHAVLDAVEAGEADIPDADMVVGGFPCFVAGTPVLTADGHRPVEELSVGDEVVTHEGRLRRVVRTGHRGGAPLTTVFCAGSRPVTCTPEHPFMVRSREGDAFGELHGHAAADLVPGRDFVLASHVRMDEAMRDERLLRLSRMTRGVGDVNCAVWVDGLAYVPVRDTYARGVRGTVYNLEVEGDHTYVVGDLVVHNCQDYSVAKPLSMAGGIEGKKGVLWWEIHRLLKLKEPKYCLFENVDRLLKSPAAQRGRDFAIILACLNSLGYAVEWRVVNSAAYGFPQRRKRVYVYAERDAGWDVEDRLRHGVMARALPIEEPGHVMHVAVGDDPYEITREWPASKTSPFLEAGCCRGFEAVTCRVTEAYDGKRLTLGDVVVPASEVPDGFWVPDAQLPRWAYLKGAKREERVAGNGHRYWYSEGSMAYPDLLTNPSRTILTSEGGSSPSRTKHVVEQGGRLRRLVPDELDRLQGFPAGWTDTGMTDVQRAFCMGNALVVGVVRRIGAEIAGRS